MATELHEGQTLKRTVRVYGVEAPVIVLLSAEGIEFKVKGSKVGVAASWAYVVDACATPCNVPSKLFDQPLEFLKDTARRIVARKAKKETKGETN